MESRENDKTTLLALSERFLAMKRWDSVVPIYRHNLPHDSKRLVGTGCLIGVADELFFVTAAHVLKPFLAHADEDKVLVADVENGIAARVDLAPGDTTSAFAAEPADVVVIRISNELRTQLSGIAFLSTADLDGAANWRSDILMVVGFPAERNPTATQAPSTVGYSTLAPSFTPSALENFEADVNGLFKINYNNSISTDSDQPWLPDSFRGMSGSPVWVLSPGHLPNAPLEPFTHVVGIQTGTFPKVQGEQLGKFTNIDVVLKLIRRLCPNLERALKLSTRNT